MSDDVTDRPVRRQRVDAQRNLETLVDAARVAFAESGVDVPARDVADRAGVGVGTLYRHFPQRSDLVIAVFRRAVDAAADAAPALAAEHEPGEALVRWIRRFTEFLATKRGLAAALHSGDPAFESLPDYFMGRFGPALEQLLTSAAATGEFRDDVSAPYLLHAVGNLSLPWDGESPEYNRAMVEVLIDGLRVPGGR
jgi:AcrR family transcriptional regulator